MTKVLEARYYRDPADVAEENELRDRAAEARRKKRAPMERIHKSRRIKALVAAVMKGKR